MEPTADRAEHLLRSAESARARGASTVGRPWWYAIGLGLSVGLAVASFAVPGMATAGVVVGAILLPVALEFEARRRTGGSPMKSYLEGPTRRTALAYVAGGAAVAGASLGALKVTGANWVVLPGALLLAVGTVIAARRIERFRGRAEVAGQGRGG